MPSKSGLKFRKKAVCSEVFRYSGTVSFTGRNRWVGVAYSAPLCPSVVFSCYLFVIPRGNGPSWPKPQCPCNTMATIALQA